MGVPGCTRLRGSNRKALSCGPGRLQQISGPLHCECEQQPALSCSCLLLDLSRTQTGLVGQSQPGDKAGSGLVFGGQTGPPLHHLFIISGPNLKSLPDLDCVLDYTCRALGPLCAAMTIECKKSRVALWFPGNQEQGCYLSCSETDTAKDTHKFVVLSPIIGGASVALAPGPLSHVWPEDQELGGPGHSSLVYPCCHVAGCNGQIWLVCEARVPWPLVFVLFLSGFLWNHAVSIGPFCVCEFGRRGEM